MTDHFFSSGAAALKLIYHLHNDRDSGESPNTYIYTITFFFFTSWSSFWEILSQWENGLLPETGTFSLKKGKGKSFHVCILVW